MDWEVYILKSYKRPEENRSEYFSDPSAEEFLIIKGYVARL